MMNKLTKVPTVIPAISVIDMGRCNWVPMSFPPQHGDEGENRGQAGHQNGF